MSPTPLRRVGMATFGLGVASLLWACDPVSKPRPDSEAPPIAQKPPASTAAAPSPTPSAPPSAAAPSAGLLPTMPSMEDSIKPLANSGTPFVAKSSSVGVYPGMSSSRREKIGYLRRGGRALLIEGSKPVTNDDCKEGWYSLLGGGYVCGNDGTTNLEDPAVKLGTQPPVLTDILPYRYARNSENGTPLYKTVPTQEQMLKYEPYLKDKDKGKTDKGGSSKKVPATAPSAASSAAPEAPPPVKDVDGGAEGQKTWWQREGDDHLSQLKHEDLSADEDDVLSMRMVKGFYIAIDKVFNWNGRTWYKTTKGLVAPADRMWMTDASDFKGTDLGSEHHLPVGWVYGFHKERPKFQIDPETKKLTPAGSAKHFDVVDLTGDVLKIGKTTYVATLDGTWMKQDDLRITEPGELPKDLQPDERWVEIDISSQTLVAYIGSTPVFASLVSSGKESKIKEKDHATPRGEWRIREKHLATTMDGDGTAAGDLPYSIEDVPYVMYFFKAFALHGAFWHRNYGVKMSHGCVNLAPLDAKRLFFFLGPSVPQGWHGAWARENSPGSRVVVHD